MVSFFANILQENHDHEEKDPDSRMEERSLRFDLQKPDVRQIMEPFIYDFRLKSVPKDDLAGLVKNSGVFTEHEQLIVSYYLLDQTKSLGRFSMKLRGSHSGEFRFAEHIPFDKSIQFLSL